MSIKWRRLRGDRIEIKCPYCCHKAVPPAYPYCKHTVFVYIDPSADDPGFDFVTPDFAVAYLSRLKTSNMIPQKDLNISPEAEQAFLNGKLQAFDRQEIRLYLDLISDDLFSSKATVLDVIERSEFYPTRFVVAFQTDPEK
jgi:hypothetical protein